MMKFKTISSIDVDDDVSWKDVVFLTLDIDWAHDGVLCDSIDLIECAGVQSTWFVTHDTPLLQRLRANSKFELGVHPNFNFLLQGDGGSSREVIANVKNIVPEAKSVRSHSMTQSSNLLDLFKEAGLTHDANHFIPSQAGLELKPWRLWNGLLRVPYGWEDDIYCMYELKNDMSFFVKLSGLKVFDFHPIHVFLNTESLDRYERTRPLHNNPQELIKHRYDGYGTRSRLLDLLAMAKQL